MHILVTVDFIRAGQLDSIGQTDYTEYMVVTLTFMKNFKGGKY